MSNIGKHPEPKILLVEDNPVDAILIKQALENGGFKRAPVVLDDGKPALALLRRQGEFAGERLPDFIILDLNLRHFDGAEFLAFVRRQPELSALKIIILGSGPEHTMRANVAQADCYLEKPTDAASFQNLSKRLSAFYWGEPTVAVV